MKGFSEDAARELIGRRVKKRLRTHENSAVKPRQAGRVVLYQRSEIVDGYAVLVFWGKNELWQYDTPEDFNADAE